MQERYREAVDQASQILAKALIDDIENVVEQGKLLDKHVQGMCCKSYW
jgi:phage shock protein A